MSAKIVTMNSEYFINFLFCGLLLMVISYQQIVAVPTKCALAATCINDNTTEALCMLDEANSCIRKYPSKCHLEIAACMQRKNFTDYSSIYCAMDAYLCEDEYEHWTIFFGHEK